MGYSAAHRDDDHRGPTGGSGGDGLTPAQRRAIQRLASGESATAAAASAGVHRQTLHRWLREDAAFRAAFHAWQAAAAEDARARLLALADAAVTAVAAAITAGDTRTALAILKGQGLLTPPEPGPTDPDHVARQQWAAAARAEAAIVKEEFLAGEGIFDPAKVPPRRRHVPGPTLPPHVDALPTIPDDNVRLDPFVLPPLDPPDGQLP